MPAKKGADPVEVPPLPDGIYDYNTNESLQLDLNQEEETPLNQYTKYIADLPKIFPGNYLAYCALAGAHPHPSILRLNKSKHGEEKSDAESQIPFEEEYIDDIQSIVIKNQVLDTTSLRLLLLSLRGNTKINELYLFNCALSKTGFDVLAKGLPFTDITTFVLDYNPFIGDDDAAIESDEGKINVNEMLVSSIFNEESKLVSISLRGNHIDSRLVQVMAEKLALNTKVKSLNLFDNDIDDQGLESLLKMGLQENKTIENLSISNNKFSSLNELVECFPASLKYLNIAQNDKVQINDVDDLITSLTSIKDTKIALQKLSLKNSATKVISTETKDKIKILSEQHGIEVSI